jgi:hypothetical protein
MSSNPNGVFDRRLFNLQAGANQMDDDRREWQRKFTSNFVAREFLRLMGAWLIWTFLSVVLGIALGVFIDSAVVSTILIFAFFVLLIVSPTWKPAYSVFRMILGNKNLPTEPRPRSHTKLVFQKHPWWYYLPGIWGWLMTLILMYLVIKYFTK